MKEEKNNFIKKLGKNQFKILLYVLSFHVTKIIRTYEAMKP